MFSLQDAYKSLDEQGAEIQNVSNEVVVVKHRVDKVEDTVQAQGEQIKTINNVFQNFLIYLSDAKSIPFAMNINVKSP